MSNYTVAYGNAFDGLTFYGVFDSFDAAELWADRHDTFGYWIVELQEAEH